MWRTTPKKSKVKIKHLTYEEILAEADEQPRPATSLGQIIDATGATVRNLLSCFQTFSHWTVHLLNSLEKLHH